MKKLVSIIATFLLTVVAVQDLSARDYLIGFARFLFSKRMSSEEFNLEVLFSDTD